MNGGFERMNRKSDCDLNLKLLALAACAKESCALGLANFANRRLTNTAAFAFSAIDKILLLKVARATVRTNEIA
jgi:hypothetical protein